jgi:hypothetical protein
MAYAYKRSAKTANAIAAAVESGMISINHHGLALPEVPFGGVKDSGYGSEGGLEAIEKIQRRHAQSSVMRSAKCRCCRTSLAPPIVPTSGGSANWKRRTRNCTHG